MATITLLGFQLRDRATLLLRLHSSGGMYGLTDSNEGQLMQPARTVLVLSFPCVCPSRL
jgi:hypothetical protein